jgi:hypothetical protein
MAVPDAQLLNLRAYVPVGGPLDSSLRSGLSNSKLATNFARSVPFLVEIPHQDNRVFAKFSLGALRTGRHNAVPAPASVHIKAIVRCGSSVEMLRIYARRVIAMVKHVKSIRNRTFKMLITRAMCIVVNLVLADASVAVFHPGTRKNQAVSRWNNLSLYPLPEGKRTGELLHNPAAFGHRY